jgi:hypothetical protein
LAGRRGNDVLKGRLGIDGAEFWRALKPLKVARSLHSVPTAFVAAGGAGR